MDGQKFDELTRALAGDTSRRGILRGIAGTALGGALALFGVSRGGAAPAGKVGICHVTDSATNPLVYIEVSANALPDHTAHGDLVSCPGAGFIDPATCTCDCALDAEADCQNLEVVDEAACACYCDTVNTTCDPGFTLDPDSCSCYCAMTDEQCPNLEIVDKGTCSCFCPADQITCGEGTVFNPETCTCDDAGNPNPECIGATCTNFPNCEGRTDCFCFTTSDGGGFCAVSVSCSMLSGCPNGQSDCAEGELCLVDTCCGDPVCKPTSYGCQDSSFSRIQTIVDDGPTTGHP